jgi:hypothetical protein
VDNTSQPSNPFERIEEYKAVLEDTAQAANRRRTDSALYVGLNTLFLTGIGLFASPNIGSWETVLALAVVTSIAIPVNLMWYTSLTYWMRSLSARQEYIRSIEREFRTRSGSIQREMPVGLYLHLGDVGQLVRLERRFALFFALFYPVSVLALALVTYVLHNPTLPPLLFHW